MWKLMMAAALTMVSFHPTDPPGGKEQRSPGLSVWIVYNNIPGEREPVLTTAGGFGAWIEFDGRAILFDAGGDSTVLTRNLKAMGRDLGSLDTVFISHNHWDHVYGLPGPAGAAGAPLKLHVPHSSRDAISEQIPRASVLSGEKPYAIRDGVWSTGSMQAEWSGAVLGEQSLVVDAGDGLHVFVGCSHPGITRIVEKAKEMFPGRPILLVAGGFHLRDHGEKEIWEISARLRQLGVRKIGPSHCTGEAAIRLFMEEWKDDLVRLYLGDEYHAPAR